MERTLAIVKPNAVRKNRIGAIISAFEESGLKLVGLKLVRLTKAQAEAFYDVHRGKPFYAELVAFMTSGPVAAMALEGPNAVEIGRATMGATDPAKAKPGTIRARFGESMTENAVHGSDSPENAAREIAFFFSSVDLVPPAD